MNEIKIIVSPVRGNIVSLMSNGILSDKLITYYNEDGTIDESKKELVVDLLNYNDIKNEFLGEPSWDEKSQLWVASGEAKPIEKLKTLLTHEQMDDLLTNIFK